MTFLILTSIGFGRNIRILLGNCIISPCVIWEAFAELPAQFVYYEPREGGDGRKHVSD